MEATFEDDDNNEIETLKRSFEQDSGGNRSKAVIKERYEIDFNSPLKWLDNNGAQAYKVIDKVDVKKELFALICDNTTAPRSSLLPYLRSLEHAALMNLVEYSIVKIPSANADHMALIYKLPLGGKVIDHKEGDVVFKNHFDKFKQALLKLISAAEALRGYDVTHRAIRLDNLYYKDIARTEIIIGDCIAAFPAFHQPPAYETIESLVAQKEGRGEGSHSNDFYAVGATALALFLGHELTPNVSAPEILRLKLKIGSYQTLSGSETVPNLFANIFRGLLNDNQENRWDYIQTYNYLDGKPGTFQSVIHERPRKSIIINNERVYVSKDVAFSMQNNVEETYELIKNGKLLDWVKNGLANATLTTRIERIIHQEIADNTKPDIVVAKICILIAPSFPIKIKDLSIYPDGAPKAIFYSLKTGKNIDPFYKIFSSDLIKMWYQEQENVRSPRNASEFKIYINSNDIGYGLDRIIYDFDPDLPCLSPLLGDNFVNSATKILKALDSTYAAQKFNEPPYDNNLIAYLRCKMGKKLDKILSDLNSRSETMRASAILRVYTSMQNKYGPAQLPNLGIWLINYAKPIIKSYNNLKYQRYLEKAILRTNKTGHLNEIWKLIENQEAKTKDRSDYSKAVKEVQILLDEKNKILNEEKDGNKTIISFAERVSLLLAIFTMIGSFVLNLINWMIQ